MLFLEYQKMVARLRMKNLYKLLGLVLLCFVCSSTLTNAQERCQTVDVYRQAQIIKSNLPGGLAFERQLARLTQNAALRAADDTSIYRIPVVFHIIHKGESIGTGLNVSDAIVRNQLRVLNEDFRKKLGTPGYNNDPRGADTKIEFSLAVLAPDGTTTTGINRYLGRTTPYSIGDNTEIKSFAFWNACQYVNIWVCNLEGSYLGYSTFPSLAGFPISIGAPYPEGVVLDYATLPGVSQTGRYNKGRSATHEIGHYLGLVHLWGDQGSCSGDDYCNDTPVQEDAINGCPTTATVCSGHGPPMIPNYLNYTDDACMNIFTTDQVGRMRVIMNHAENRPCLRTSPALVDVVEPVKLRFRFQLFPNPSNGEFSISDDSARPGKPTKIWVVDILGRRIFNGVLTGGPTKINLRTVKAGVYYIQHDNGDAQGTLRVIVHGEKN